MKRILLFLLLLGITSCKNFFPYYQNGYHFNQIFSKDTKLILDEKADSFSAFISETSKVLVYYSTDGMVHLIDLEGLIEVSTIPWVDNSNYYNDIVPDFKQLYIYENYLYLLGSTDCLVYLIEDISNPSFKYSISENNTYNLNTTYYLSLRCMDNKIYILDSNSFSYYKLLLILDADNMLEIERHYLDSFEGVIDKEIYLNSNYLYTFSSELKIDKDGNPFTITNQMIVYDITDISNNYELVDINSISLEDNGFNIYNDIIVSDGAIGLNSEEYFWSIIKLDSEKNMNFYKNVIQQMK